MPTTQQPQYDLAELAERYEILGELAGSEAATTYIARRRDDGADVQVSLFTAPQGDEGNALSHLAADVNLLAGATHAGLAPILEGAWAGPDAFAIVTRRISAPTLDELLLKREEPFALPRIAAILSQINGTLRWARERRVVHRGVTPRTIVIEPGTDRPILAFVVRPLPLTEMPGAEEDARSIAQLARAMLTRSVGAAAQERAGQPLAELRPGLPEVVITQTEQLLAPERDGPAPDVIGYIGAIAMGEALKEGEAHLERTRNLIEEQKREHEAQLERERRDHDQRLADERAKWQKTVDDQAKKFQREREDFERQLRKDNETLARERAALAAEREAHRLDCERLEREREEHEREIRRVQEQLEWEAAALATQQELYARTDEYRTPVADERPAVVADPARNGSASGWAHMWRARPAWLTRRGTIAAALLVVIAVLAIALGRGRRTGASVATGTSAARVVDSVSGGVEPVVVAPAVVIASPSPESASVGVPADFLTVVAARADSAPKIPWWRRMLRRNRDTVARRPAPVEVAPKLDTIFATPSIMRWDTLIRRDTIRPDTLRRDTSVIRDTTRRDTLIIRDTLREGRGKPSI